MSTSPKVQVYATAWCGFCRAAKDLLQDRGIPYEEIDVTDRPNFRSELRERFGWPTVPVVLAGGELIGGYSELAALDRSRGLDHLK